MRKGEGYFKMTVGDKMRVGGAVRGRRGVRGREGKGKKREVTGKGTRWRGKRSGKREEEV